MFRRRSLEVNDDWIDALDLLEGVRFIFDLNTISPIAHLIASTLSRDLAPEFDPRLWVRFKPFIEPDKAFELQREDQDLRLKVRSPQQILRDRGAADPEADAPWGENPVGTLAEVPYTGEDVFAGTPGRGGLSP